MRRVLVKCIPKEVLKPLALHLEEATTFQQMRKLIMRQMHDELIGMLEGETAQPLFTMSSEEPPAEETQRTPDELLTMAEENWNKAETEHWTAARNQTRQR